MFTLLGAVKRGSLARHTISSPLSSADLQNKATLFTDNKIGRFRLSTVLTYIC